MGDVYSTAFDYERDYGGCAQCTFAALQDALNRHEPEADAVFRSATGLAGGGGGEGDGHCGAYSGAVMMIGYLAGRARDDFPNRTATRRVREVVGRLHEKFIAEYGTVVCHGIHRKIFGRPFYINDPDESAKFNAAGAHTDKCTAVVGKTAQWALQILQDEGLGEPRV